MVQICVVRPPPPPGGAPSLCDRPPPPKGGTGPTKEGRFQGGGGGTSIREQMLVFSFPYLFPVNSGFTLQPLVAVSLPSD